MESGIDKRQRCQTFIVIYQNKIIIFAELFIIRFGVKFCVLPNSSGLLEKKWHASGAAELMS